MPAIENLGLTRSSQQQVQDLKGEHAPAKTPNAKPVAEPASNQTQEFKQYRPSSATKDPAAMRAAMEQARALEQGHATGPTAEQKARAEWETKKAVFDAAKATNAPLDARIAELTQQKTHLETLFNSGQLKGDGVLTWKELEWLAQNGTAEQKTAAQWMKDNKADFWDSMEKASTKFDVDGTANVNGEPVGRGLSWSGFVAKNAEMDGYISQVRAQKVPMPADPGPAPGGSLATSQSASTGGPTTTEGTGNTAGSKETRDQVEGRVFENYKKVGPFSSNATSAEGRLQDATGHVQKGIDALQNDLIAASTKEPPNQAEIMMIQNKMQQLQNALSALMQMMKQQQEMQSNMSKMFSEMASSAIRNMR